MTDAGIRTETRDLYDVGTSPPPGHVPTRMHAWVLRQEYYGEPEVSFRHEVIETPLPGPGEVLVEIMAAGINYNGVWAARGTPIDVVAYKRRRGGREAFHICGTDASGIVRAVGEDVTDLEPGTSVSVHGAQWDRECPYVLRGDDPVNSPTYKVWGYETNWGAFAQFARVQRHQCMPKPPQRTWEEAAAALVSAGAAYRMLFGWPENRVESEDVVLIWGGAGGLGSVAIQMARRVGARPVAVVSSPERAEFCRRLGAVGTIDRRDFDHWGALPPIEDEDRMNDWLRGRRHPGRTGALGFRRALRKAAGTREDPRVVFEHPGEHTLPTSLFVCAPGGMVVICAGTTGYLATLDLRHLWMKQKRLQGSHAGDDEDLNRVNDMVRDGELDPCLSRTFAWQELPEAHQTLADNRHPPGNMAVLINAPEPALGMGS